MCGEIERTADQIAAGTADPAVRRAAIRWKIDAVPALSAALFQPEPLTAVLDTWVLFNQMADFFETGAGKEQLGDSAPVAVESCRRLEQEIADVFAAMTVSGDVSRVRAFAKSWAAAHPIRYAIPDRESGARPGAGAGGARVLVHGRGGGGDHDLDRRPQPEARRLQRSPLPAGPLGSGAARRRPEAGRRAPLAERAVQSAESLAAAFDRLAPGIERVAAVAEGAPGIVASERKAAIDGLGQRADADDRVPPGRNASRP